MTLYPSYFLLTKCHLLYYPFSISLPHFSQREREKRKDNNIVLQKETLMLEQTIYFKKKICVVHFKNSFGISSNYKEGLYTVRNKGDLDSCKKNKTSNLALYRYLNMLYLGRYKKSVINMLQVLKLFVTGRISSQFIQFV